MLDATTEEIATSKPTALASAVFNEALPPKDIYKLALSGFCTHPNTFLSTNGYPYIAPVPRQLRPRIKSRKIFKYKKANEETGDAFFQGYGKINGLGSPSGKDYRFKVWVTASKNDQQDYTDKFRLQIYWTENKRGMRVYVFDNELNPSLFYGKILVDPGATATDE